jgi:hypothetical protein
MADTTTGQHIKLLTTLREALSAGQAVRAGIATHAEAHRHAMQSARAKLLTERRLAGKTPK